jgi:hypothetical protein
MANVDIHRLSPVRAASTLDAEVLWPHSFTRERKNMAPSKLSTLFLIPALMIVAGVAAANSAATASASEADHAPILETQMTLRDLWIEHVFWIRNYVTATHAGDARQSKVAEAEVLANAKTLAETITPFYGQAAADQLLKLLAGHWSAIRDYNTAVLDKSKTDEGKASAALTANAREIAKFLSGANPHLPEDAVFGLLSSHGGHHIAQIDEIATKSFQDEASTWHAMRKHMLVISDAIAAALAKQFPERFQEAT